MGSNTATLDRKNVIILHSMALQWTADCLLVRRTKCCCSVLRPTTYFAVYLRSHAMSLGVSIMTYCIRPLLLIDNEVILLHLSNKWKNLLTLMGIELGPIGREPSTLPLDHTF